MLIINNDKRSDQIHYTRYLVLKELLAMIKEVIKYIILGILGKVVFSFKRIMFEILGIKELLAMIKEVIKYISIML